MKALLLLLPLALAACTFTDTIHFTGPTVSGSRLLAMASEDRETVLVKTYHHPFFLSLPYSEDWTLKSSPRLPLSGFSPMLEMHVCVLGPLNLPNLNEEKYLNERLPDIRSTLGADGLTVDHEVFKEYGGHTVLLLRNGTRSVSPMGQNHIWGVRRAPTEECYEIHFATAARKREMRLELLAEAVRSIVGPMFATEEPPK